MNSTVILGALELGGIFAVLSLGLYISFKVLNIPDLTVDGSFTTGCAVSARSGSSRVPNTWYGTWICGRCDCWDGHRITHH